MCAESHFYVSKSTFSNRIFLLEKKAVIYEKASDSLMVLSVWALSVLLCFFHPQEGPARPVASSEWEENRLGWCLPHTASAWEAEAGRSEVRVQLWPHGETVSKTAEKKRKMSPVTPLFCFPRIFSFLQSHVAHETSVFHVAVAEGKWHVLCDGPYGVTRLPLWTYRSEGK